VQNYKRNEIIFNGSHFTNNLNSENNASCECAVNFRRTWSDNDYCSLKIFFL